MPPRRGSTLPTPNERALQDALARLRKRSERTKTDERHYLDLRELSDRLGLDVNEVIEEFESRAACRQYDAGLSRTEAEQLAYEDTVARFRRQEAIAI